MSVQELSQLHRRYIDLSDRFKAAWTFHQFLQGVQKVFVEEDVGLNPISFQELYASLKGVSQNLNAAATGELRQRLDRIDHELSQRLQLLLQEDNKVSPSLLRQFFERVKSYDEKILTQLLKFYVLTHQGEDWEHDRIDKVDFLITKLGEEIQDLKVAAILRDPTRVKEIFQSLWVTLGRDPASDEEIEGIRGGIQVIREEFGLIENLDELNERACVPRYRSLKHDLGGLIFEPEIAPLVLETNLFVRHSIQELYQLEERRITTEYQEVFELARDATPDTELDQDLKQFHQEIETFERHLQAKNVRLEELAYIRGRVRDLLPRLKQAVTGAASVEGPQEGFAMGEPPSVPVVSTARFQDRALDAEILEAYVERLAETLGNADEIASPRAVTGLPEVKSLRLLARDVVAYRRLHDDDGECDRELEEFVLDAAALRVRINEEAEEIASARDLGPGKVDDTVLGRARGTTRIADSFEKRFSHFITQALQDGELTEAQALQILRMRLLRDYAGLWLLAHAN